MLLFYEYKYFFILIYLPKEDKVTDSTQYTCNAH